MNLKMKDRRIRCLPGVRAEGRAGHARGVFEPRGDRQLFTLVPQGWRKTCRPYCARAPTEDITLPCRLCTECVENCGKARFL